MADRKDGIWGAFQRDFEHMRSAYDKGGLPRVVGDAIHRGATGTFNAGKQWAAGGARYVGNEVSQAATGLGSMINELDLGVTGRERQTRPPGTLKPDRRVGNPKVTGSVPQDTHGHLWRPDGTTVEGMLAEQREGVPAYWDKQAEYSHEGGPAAMPQIPAGMERLENGAYRQWRNDPGQMYGRALYTDNPGRDGIAKGAAGLGAVALDMDGNPAFGPFGRSDAEQKAIENRVAQIQRATDFIRSMRGVPSERERLNRRARQSISLDQGLGAFMNQAGDRNYARKELASLDERESNTAKNDAAQLKTLLDAQRFGFDRQAKGEELRIDQLKADQDRFKVIDNDYGIGSIFDTRTGQFHQPPAEPMTLEQASKQAEQEYAAMDDSLLSDPEAVDENGNKLTREQWIERRVAELTAQPGQPGQLAQLGDVTDEDLAETAKASKMSVEQVRAILEMLKGSTNGA